MAITVDLQRLKRFWLRDRGELRFLLRVNFGGFEPDVDQLVEVARGVRTRLARSSNPVDAEQWIKTKTGWSGVLVNVANVDDALEWFEPFVATWAAVADGTIVGGPRSPGTGIGTLPPEPTAFVAYTTGDLNAVPSNDRGPLWFVEEKITRFVAEKAQAWVYTRGGRQFLSRNADWSVELEGVDWELGLAQAIDRYVLCEVACTQTKPTRQRMAQFVSQGETVYQVADPTLGWRERLDQVRETLTWTPPNTNLAFVRTDDGNSVAWNSYLNPWPHVREGDVRYNRPLLASMVPDVNGIQLLTAAHLARAHDLSAWNIQELAGGRYLVEAPDLDPWYSEARPDRDVLAKARSDFGDMIMTPDLIRTNSPWSR